MTTDKSLLLKNATHTGDVIPGSAAIRFVDLLKATSFEAERHAWGQFVYPVAGSIEITVAAKRYTTPPDCGLWLPPGTEHLAWAVAGTSYVLLDLHPDLCSQLPDQAAAIPVGGIGKAIFNDLRVREVPNLASPQDERLLEVLLDQFGRVSRETIFLPLSNDRHLRQVLDGLIQDPGDSRSLADWARYVNTTERTLARRCKRDLGMTFHRWRQKLRVARSLSMLADGHAVRTVSEKVGYRNSSAFIAMFSAENGLTPSAYQARLKNEQR